MSGAIIGALRAVLSFESAAFESGLKKAQSSLGSFEKRMKTTGANIAKAGVAISLVGAGVALAFRGQINAADDMSKAAQKFGIPIETLSQLAHAADLSDVSMQTMGTSVNRLSKQMVAAKNGSKASAKMFSDIGVAVTDATGALRPAEAVLMDLSDVIAKMPDGAEKSALAMQFLGKSGTDMIPLLNGGGQALRDMMGEADALGLTITQKTGTAAELFNDNLTRLQGALTGLTNQIMTAILPALISMTEWLKSGAAWFGKLSPITQQWVAIAAGITVVLGPVLVGLGMMVSALGVLSGAFTGLFALMLANPFVLVGAAIVAVAVLIYKNWEPIKAFFAELWGFIQSDAQAAVDLIQQGWTALSTWFTGLVTEVGGYFVGLWTDIQTQAGLALALLQATWVGIGPWFDSQLALVKQAFIDGWEKIKAVAAQWVQDFRNFGAEIVAGLQAGIEAKWNDFVNYMNAKTQAISDGFASLLGIKSPSTVFRQFGQWIMEGLGLGIGDGLPVVTDAMGGVADAIGGSGASLSSGLSEFGSTVKDVFKGIVSGSMTAKDAVAGLVSKLADMATNKLFDSLGSAFGGPIGGILGSLFGAANGAVINGGRLQGFAAGGIANGPTLFPMRSGAGLMGEAGPEAIMPLTRVGGKLGVQSVAAAAPAAVNVNPQIINVLDPSVVGEYMATRAGQQQILNIMRRSGVAVNG